MPFAFMGCSWTAGQRVRRSFRKSTRSTYKTVCWAGRARAGCVQKVKSSLDRKMDPHHLHYLLFFCFLWFVALFVTGTTTSSAHAYQQVIGTPAYHRHNHIIGICISAHAHHGKSTAAPQQLHSSSTAALQQLCSSSPEKKERKRASGHPKSLEKKSEKGPPATQKSLEKKSEKGPPATQNH